jgi:hypothetical protein
MRFAVLAIFCALLPACGSPAQVYTQYECGPEGGFKALDPAKDLGGYYIIETFRGMERVYIDRDPNRNIPDHEIKANCEANEGGACTCAEARY